MATPRSNGIRTTRSPHAQPSGPPAPTLGPPSVRWKVMVVGSPWKSVESLVVAVGSPMLSADRRMQHPMFHRRGGEGLRRGDLGTASRSISRRSMSSVSSSPIPSSRIRRAKLLASRAASFRVGDRTLATKVPCRPRVSSNPASSNSRYARATVLAASPRSVASCRTGGRRSAGWMLPVSMATAICSRTCSNGAIGDSGSRATNASTSTCSTVRLYQRLY